MRNSKFIFLSIFAVILTGCAAFGVPYTKDPATKISYSYELIDLGRPIPAERLANEALVSFTEAGNTFGMAEAHTFLGVLYKHPSYRQFSKFFEGGGEYDPTNDKSIFHSKKAIDLFESIGNFTQTAKVKFSMANAYLSSNEEKACQLYDESIDAYEKGKTLNPGDSFQFNPNFKTFEELVRAFEAEYCAKSA